MFLSAHKATKKINFKALESGTRLYEVSKYFPDDISSISSTIKKNYAYAGVSSSKQKQDLERQKEILRSKYSEYELISDIGSGIDFKQRNLQSFFDKAF